MSPIDESDQEILTDAEVSGTEGLGDWRVLLGRLHARFATGDFVTGLRLADQIGEAAEEAGHHPDLDLRYPHLEVTLTSHDVGGLTRRDVRLARRISELAAAAGVSADPRSLQRLEVALDSPDHTAIKPFWKAALGLDDHPRHSSDLVDPDGAVPALWFQTTSDEGTARMRFHLDITVPHDVAEQRVAEALKAGGTLVTDEFAPAFWVLEDAEGNKVCVCTWQGREGSSEV